MLPPLPATTLFPGTLPPGDSRTYNLHINFNPINLEASYGWIDSLDVLRYLLQHPTDRNHLQTEACRRGYQEDQTYLIQHPRLTCFLPLGSWDTDFLFLCTIKHQLITLERQNGNFNPIFHTVIQPLHIPFILNPFNVEPELAAETATKLAKKSFPCEIIILPTDVLVRELLSYETIVHTDCL